MIIKTNRKIYVGRTNLKQLQSNTPDPVYGFCNPIIPTPFGKTEPLFIPENTEVTKLDGSRFNSKDEFIDELESNCYYGFVLDGEMQKILDWCFDCGCIPFDDKNSYNYISD